MFQFAYSDEFSGLISWKEVNQQQQELLAREFACLLPSNIMQDVGKPYWLIGKPISDRDQTDNDLFK